MKFWVILILALASTLKVNLFTLHTSSACVSKKFSIANLNISSKSDILIHSDGLLCGEDDFIVNELDNIKFLTVVDGVGSWNHDGVNPKYFVTEFIHVLTQKFEALDFKTIKDHDNENFLLNLVDESLNLIVNAKNIAEVKIGSCTIASMSINMKTLHANAYHLGDAAYMIVRDSKVLFKSEDIMKRFNLPFQLGPPNSIANVDDPKLGKIENFPLKVNDVIVIGSDGLFDNLFDYHIVEVVHHAFYKNLKKIENFNISKAAKKIANILTIEAKEIGESPLNILTPFAAAYRKAFGRKVGGGKNDDTTVVVGIISN